MYPSGNRIASAGTGENAAKSRLTERQPEPIAAEKMEVEMTNRLAGIVPDIRRQAISGLGDVEVVRDVHGHPQHPLGHTRLQQLQFLKRDDMASRDDQTVDSGLGMNIAKNQDVIITIDNARRERSGDDATEYTARLFRAHFIHEFVLRCLYFE